MMKVDNKSRGIYYGNGHQWAIVLSVAIALKVVLIFMFSWHIRLVMDEFAQLGYAKYFSSGLFETIQPTKAVGFAVFYKLAHLIGWDASSILLAGRIQTALLACATLTLVYACARALGENRCRALFIVILLLCFSNFMERIFRMRAEPLALFFALAALLVILHGQTITISTKRILIAGVFSGLAFLVTQKSVYFNIALGLGLVIDAAMRRHYITGIIRGAWLVAGWVLPVVAYCVIFGGNDPLRIAEGLIFGPMEVATRGGGEYGGLRKFVLQTLLNNILLYQLCFVGMIQMLVRINLLGERKRIAFIFSVVITTLVFIHDQPWPYVFIMALPFMSLWALAPLDYLFARFNTLPFFCLAVIIAIIMLASYNANIRYLKINNTAQIELVTRAEALLEPDEKYFDGIGMLPNRPEPTTLWLDVHYVLATRKEGVNSEAYQMLSQSPPTLILWSYRMDNIYPVVATLIRNSYVRVAPNIRMAGSLLHARNLQTFNVPIAGKYQLYSESGSVVSASVEVDGVMLTPPFKLTAGSKMVALHGGSDRAFLLPERAYAGLLKTGDDDKNLFADVYR